jgi:hypothetical protein
VPNFAQRLYSGAEQRARLKNENRGNVTRPRAADDFAAIRARMEELRRENARVPADHDRLTRPRPQSTGDKPALPLAIRRSEGRYAVEPEFQIGTALVFSVGARA